MAVLSLYYPVKPHRVTRGWGVADPLYEAFGFSLHNGVDLDLALGQEIRVPFDCRVAEIGNQPEGSGLYVALLSRSPYLFPDGRRLRVELSFMHLSRIDVAKGQRLSVGQILGTGGSTGRSSGPHTHIAPKRVTLTLLGRYRDADRNDADNTFDPTPYWNGAYA